MSRNGMPSHYFIPRGEIPNVPWQKCEGYPLPIAPDVAGNFHLRWSATSRINLATKRSIRVSDVGESIDISDGAWELFHPITEIFNVTYPVIHAFPVVHANPFATGELPRNYGSKKYNALGDSGYIVPRSYQPHARHYDDSLAFGGYSGYNFLRRDCKPGAK